MSDDLVIRGAPRDLFNLWQTGELEARGREHGVLEFVLDGPAGTGKTTGLTCFLHHLALSYPGSRQLWVRITRSSLTDSALQSYEDDVLAHYGDSYLIDGPSREHRSRYEFVNGSSIVLGGLDRPSKLYSTNWDVVYLNEGFEVPSLDPWERFRRGLRNYRMPFQLLITDTNPSTPFHWINQRCLRGKATRLLSRHIHNPKFYLPSGEPTPEGQAYVEGTLKNLTGVRYDNLYLGKWVAAEGMVWEPFDEAKHVIQRPELPEGERLQDVLGIDYFVAGQDWGWTDPGCFQVWGVRNATEDHGYAMICVEEIFQTGKGIEWWANEARLAHERWGLQAIVCDPSRPDSIQRYNEVLRQMDRPDDMRIARPADNDKTSTGKGDFGGLDRVRDWFAKDRILFLRERLLHGRDPSLSRLMKPCSTTEELPAYVYLMVDEGKPNKEHTDPACSDHGCDTLRYVVNHLDHYDHTPKDDYPEYAPDQLGGMLEHEDILKRSRGWYPGRTTEDD